MKIGFLIESMAVSSGGPARVAGSVASELAHRGHNVIVGTLPVDLEEVELHSNVQIQYLAGTVRNPLNWLKAVNGIRHLASQVDVLFVSGIWGPVDGMSLRLANVKHIPIHTRICGMLENYILDRHPFRKWLARLAYVNYNLSSSASLLVNSSSEQFQVCSLGFRTPVNILPNGVSMPSASDLVPRDRACRALGLDLSSSSKVLLYLSRIHPKKGLHDLLDAIEAPFDCYQNWHLVVAGSFYEGEHYERRIMSAVSASRHFNRIHFTGEVSGLRKNAAFSIANLFVLPSASEGFSNAVIEALSWQIPVIITLGCNFPEVGMSRAGWVVPPGSLALRDSLFEAMLDDSRLIEMGGHAKDLVQHSYLHNTVVSLYESLALSSCK